MERMNKGDTISRSALLAAYDAAHKGPPGGARKLIEEAPAVDAIPIRHGRWIVLDGQYECSECHNMDAKPRVMTAEEVAALPEGAVAWLEERFDNVGKTFIQPMMSDGRGVMIGTHIRLSVRGMSWNRRRFWTGKPGEDGERE